MNETLAHLTEAQISLNSAALSLLDIPGQSGLWKDIDAAAESVRALWHRVNSLPRIPTPAPERRTLESRSKLTDR